jgi:ankyrin repeat protein
VCYIKRRRITLIWYNNYIVDYIDVNARDNDGATPLHQAVSETNTHQTLKLLQNGADINARDNKGDTPLHWAVRAMMNLLQWFGLA